MAIAILVYTHAATPPVALTTLPEKPPVEVPVLNANDVMLPVGNTGK